MQKLVTRERGRMYDRGRTPLLCDIVTACQLKSPQLASPIGLHVLREGNHAGLLCLLSLAEEARDLPRFSTSS